MSINKINTTKRMGFGIVFAAIAMLSMQTVSWAAFTSVQRRQVTAQAFLTASGLMAMDTPQISNYNGTKASTDAITWSPGVGLAVAFGTSTWTAANVCIVVSSTFTASSGGMQIFTDVKQATYTGTDFSVGGLVNAFGLDKPVLPIAWRVSSGPIFTSDLQLTNNFRQGNTGVPAGCTASIPSGRLWIYDALDPDVCKGATYPTFSWIMDASSTTFNSQVSATVPPISTPRAKEPNYYSVVKDANYGLHYAEGSPTVAPGNWYPITHASRDYIYLVANYTSAITPANYTTKVVLQSYTE